MVPLLETESVKCGNYFERSFERAVQEETPKFHQAEACCQSETLQLPVPPGLTYNVLPRNPALSRPWHPTLTSVPSERSTYISGCGGGLPVSNLLASPVTPKVSGNAISVTIGQYPNPELFFPTPYHSDEGTLAPDHHMRGPGKFFLSMPQGIERDSVERRMRSQERNRLAAMKSRQRKKKEWERLLESEKSLALENVELKKEVSTLLEKIALLEEKLRAKEMQ